MGAEMDEKHEEGGAMKHKGDIEIGKRFVQEAYRLFPDESDSKIGRRLNCSKSMITAWKEGVTPGGYHLARIAHYGADVMWILIGGKYGMDDQTQAQG